jgi:hypothetical protein
MDEVAPKFLAREEGSVENPNAVEIENPEAKSMDDVIF